MLNNTRYLQRGFSLLEMSIVLAIVGLLLAGLMMPLSSSVDQQRLKDGRTQLKDIHDALIGFAVANGRLPCPATPSSNGRASPAGGVCAAQHGFVPARTLGLTGTRNADQLLLDPWSNPIRYSVTNDDRDADGNWDFVVATQMQSVTMALLAPDLVVCTTAAGSSATACANNTTTIVNTAPAVLLSMGKDWAAFGSADQTENVGGTLGGGPSGTNYPVPNDRVFVSRELSIRAGVEYDDIVTWVAPTALYGQMVSASQLP